VIIFIVCKEVRVIFFYFGDHTTFIPPDLESWRHRMQELAYIATLWCFSQLSVKDFSKQSASYVLLVI